MQSHLRSAHRKPWPASWSRSRWPHMHAYLFLRMRQQMAAQASHFHTAHKANVSKSCTASLPPRVRLSICSETSPTNCRRFSDFPVRPEDLLLPPADGGARAGSSTSAAGGGSTRRSLAAEISAKRCVASLTFSGLRSGCQRMASFLNAAAITSASGGPPSAPSSTPSTSAASCSSDGISERCGELPRYPVKRPWGAGTHGDTRAHGSPVHRDLKRGQIDGHLIRV